MDQRNGDLWSESYIIDLTMYWTQWSRSAGLCRGPCLSMMSMQAFWVRILISLISSEVFPILLNLSWRIIAHSTAVCAWNLSSDPSRRSLLSREGDLEQDILHDVATVCSLEFELLALEQDVVESPSLSGQHTWQSHLSLLHHQCEVDCS